MRTRMMAVLGALMALHAPTVQAQLRVTTAVHYGPDSMQRLILYRPATCPQSGCPVVVWLHGHGVPLGLAPTAYQLRLPTYRGIAVAACDYRLGATGQPDTVTLTDAKRCRRRLTRNAAAWTLDTTRVACWGSSLGGYLCNWLTTTCGDRQTGRGTPDECVKGGVALFGASTLPYQPDLIALGCPAPGQPLGDSLTSPTHYVTTTSPPWMGLHSRDDCTVPYTQSVKMDSAYRALGLLSVLRLYDGLGHGTVAWQADSIVRPQLDWLALLLK